MPNLSPLALLALLAAPVMAEANPADDFAALREAMPTLLFGTDTGLQLQLQSQVLQRLSGEWVQLAPLMPDGIEFPEADLLARACQRQAMLLEPLGNLGLTMTTATTPDPFVVTLHYAGGTTYISTVDEAGSMARLFPGKPMDSLDPELLYKTHVLSNWSGYLSLIPLGNDLILIQPLLRAPEMLARCN